MLPGSPLAAFCPEPVARNGFLLACNGCRLSAASIPGSKLLACYFASFQIVSVPGRPFGSTAAIPDCAGCGRFTAWGPLHFRYPVWPAAPAVSTPLRDFYIPRDQSVQQRCCLPVRLTNPPDFLSLPAARSNESWAADHRSRAATFPPACCSSNLLEPSSLCSRSSFASMLFCLRKAPFPQYLSGLFSDNLRD